MNTEHIKELEATIGYTFQNSAYLERALTHSSFHKTEKGKYEPKDNERMEFLGDAVLELCVSEELFLRFPDMQEGQMSKTRAGIVCESALSEAAKRIGLGAHLKLGHGEELGGGRDKPSILSDAFEALICAIYLDSGFEQAKTFVHAHVLPLLNLEAYSITEKDYKTRLQERIHQKTHGKQVQYRLLKEEGPDHKKTFTMAVELEGKILGTGTGNSKQNAGQAAAKYALEQMGETI